MWCKLVQQLAIPYYIYLMRTSCLQTQQIPYKEILKGIRNWGGKKCHAAFSIFMAQLPPTVLTREMGTVV